MYKFFSWYHYNIFCLQWIDLSSRYGFKKTISISYLLFNWSCIRLEKKSQKIYTNKPLENVYVGIFFRQTTLIFDSSTICVTFYFVSKCEEKYCDTSISIILRVFSDMKISTQHNSQYLVVWLIYSNERRKNTKYVSKTHYIYKLIVPNMTSKSILPGR